MIVKVSKKAQLKLITIKKNSFGASKENVTLQKRLKPLGLSISEAFSMNLRIGCKPTNRKLKITLTYHYAAPKVIMT